MTKKEYFFIEESPYNPGKWLIKAKYEDFYCKHTYGSYNILEARLMNLTYAQYLRFCRDILGATIIGKGNKYPVAYFQRNGNLSAFVRLLNTRANLIVWNREHPDWRNHQAQLEAMERKDYSALEKLKKELDEIKTQRATTNKSASSYEGLDIDSKTGLVNIDPFSLVAGG